MKKIILLSFMLMFGCFAFAQTDSNLVTNSDTEKLIDKYSSKLEASLISIGKSLKQPAEHVYSLLIHQQYVKVIRGLIVISLSLLFLTLFVVFGNKAKWSNGLLWETGCILSGIAGVILFAVFFGNNHFNEILQGIMNPEYGAMQDIVNMIK